MLSDGLNGHWHLRTCAGRTTHTIWTRWRQGFLSSTDKEECRVGKRRRMRSISTYIQQGPSKWWSNLPNTNTNIISEQSEFALSIQTHRNWWHIRFWWVLISNMSNTNKHPNENPDAHHESSSNSHWVKFFKSSSSWHSNESINGNQLVNILIVIACLTKTPHIYTHKCCECNASFTKSLEDAWRLENLSRWSKKAENS